ncbi:MAG TPA: DUF3089 domain-containing protein [Sediminibacterium sp.]|nr:DUF3089 domain-containing protein [Sediminibacterium sp.]
MKMLPPLICFLALTCACNRGYRQYISRYHFPVQDSIPDYSQPAFWAASPHFHDPSDSVPKPLRDTYRQDTAADIFFIHPTTYLDRNMPEGWNADIRDPQLAAKTDYSSILYQASVFNAAGRVFAPRYRQANYYAYFPKTAADSAAAAAAFDTAYADVRAAFLYYLQHENHGRPIILAAHSQGTTHALRLLKEFFDGKPLSRQLVAAYLAGMGLPKDYFTQIPLCQTPGETGCVCSWRTLREGYLPDYIQTEKDSALVTNPISWTDSTVFVDRSRNEGSILLNFNRLHPHVTGARIHQGVLWTGRLHFFGSFLYRTRNYHIADLNLFYRNIRDNLSVRLKAYAQKKGLAENETPIITPN